MMLNQLRSFVAITALFGGLLAVPTSCTASCYVIQTTNCGFVMAPSPCSTALCYPYPDGQGGYVDVCLTAQGYQPEPTRTYEDAKVITIGVGKDAVQLKAAVKCSSYQYCTNYWQICTGSYCSGGTWFDWNHTQWDQEFTSTAQTCFAP